MMAEMKTIFDIGDEIWEDDVLECCKHKECPYKDCIYHRYTTGYNLTIDCVPFYQPKNKEEMKTCMSYLDI